MSTKRVVLRFPASIADAPVIYYLVRDYDLMVNILKANINPHKEGTMVMQLSGENWEQGVAFLKAQGVEVLPLSQEVARDEHQCTSCGACTAICPTGALFIERPSMRVSFDGEKCIVCQLCVKACPVHAMEVRF